MIIETIRVVLPVADVINPVTFKYESAMVAAAAFDWALNFKWKYFEWSYFDIEENNVKPFR